MNKQHTELKGKYILGALIKNSSRSYQAKNKHTGETFVIKDYDISQMSQSDTESLEDQVRQIINFKHINFVKVIEQIRLNGHMYVVQEYVENGSINYIAGLLNENLLQLYILQLIQALLYLNQKPFIINDFRLDNIYLSKQGSLKIQLLKSSNQYVLSPEQAMGVKRTTETNIFEFGLIINHLVTGEQSELVGNVQRLQSDEQVVLPPETLQCSQNVAGLLRTCLVKDLEQRKNIIEIFTQNPWLSSIRTTVGEEKEVRDARPKEESVTEAEPVVRGKDDMEENISLKSPIQKLQINRQKISVRPRQQKIQIITQTQADRGGSDLDDDQEENIKASVKIQQLSPRQNNSKRCIVMESVDYSSSVHIRPQEAVTIRQMIGNDDETITFDNISHNKFQIAIQNIKDNKKRAPLHKSAGIGGQIIDFDELEQESILMLDQRQKDNKNLPFVDVGLFQKDFVSNWNQLFQLQEDSADPEKNIQDLERLYDENPEYFIECFNKLYQVNQLLQVFHQYKEDANVIFQYVDFLNKVQHNVTFNYKCQVVGYQSQLIDYLSSAGCKKHIQTHQQCIYKYIQVSTKYIFKANKKGDDAQILQNQFILFVNNNGIKLFNLLLRINQYKKPNESLEDLVFNYFNEQNILLQQQIFLYINEAGKIINQKQYIFSLLTQCTGLEDNIIYSLLLIMNQMLLNYQVLKIQKPVTEATYLNLVYFYAQIALNCIRYCTLQQVYQEVAIIRLINSICVNIMLIELKMKDPKMTETVDLLMNEVILMISECQHPKNDEFVKLSWEVLQDTFGRMLKQLQNSSVKTQFLIQLTQNFIIGSEVRRREFIILENMQSVLSLIDTSSNRSLTMILYNLLGELLKDQDVIQRLLGNNKMLHVNLLKVGLQLFCQQSHVWLNLALSCLIHVSSIKDSDGQGVIDKLELDDIEGIEMAEQSAIKDKIRQIYAKQYVKTFANEVIVNGFQRLFSTSQSLMAKVVNDSFMKNVFYTIKENYNLNSLLVGCLYLLRTIFQSQPLRTKYYSKFSAAIKLLLENGNKRIQEICRQIVENDIERNIT